MKICITIIFLIGCTSVAFGTELIPMYGTYQWFAPRAKEIETLKVFSHPNIYEKISGHLIDQAQYSVFSFSDNYHFAFIKSVNDRWNPFDDISGWVLLGEKEKTRIADYCLNRIEQKNSTFNIEQKFNYIQTAIRLGRKNMTTIRKEIELGFQLGISESIIWTLYDGYQYLSRRSVSGLSEIKSKLMNKFKELSIQLFEKSEYQRAMMYAKPVLDANPNEVSMRLIYGKSAISLGNFKTGEKSIVQVLELDPNNVFAKNSLERLALIYRNLGLNAFDNSNFAFALRYLQHSINLNPEQNILYEKITLCYDHQNLVNLAMETIQTGLGYYPEDPALILLGQELAPKLLELAKFAHISQQYHEGIQYFLLATQFTAPSSEDFYYLGENYLYTNRFSDAKTAYNKALSLDRYSKSLDRLVTISNKHFYKGLDYFEKKQFRIAAKEFETVVSINKHFLPGYFWLAKTNMTMKKLESAYRNIQQLLFRNPLHRAGDQLLYKLEVNPHFKIRPEF